MTPHVVEFIRTEWTAEQFTDALMVRKAVQNKMSRLMREYDLLITEEPGVFRTVILVVFMLPGVVGTSSAGPRWV